MAKDIFNRPVESVSPQIVAPTDFTLDNEKSNKNMHRTLWPKASEILIDEDRNLFYRTGDDQNGWYAGYDKRVGMLYYLVQIKRLNKKLSGQTVTQTLVWRWAPNKLALDITNKVIFDILLRRYKAIMSDAQQTPDGGQFWKKLLTKAHTKHYHIGLLNFQTGEIVVPEKGEDPAEFVLRIENSAWGELPKYQALRFIISNSELTPTK